MLVNGHPQHSLPLTDRAIHYGDGAFETVRVKSGKLIYWDRHLARLQRTCAVLQLPFEADLIEQDVHSLMSSHAADSILKVMITRGSGGRGYSPPDHVSASRIVMQYALPADYSLLAREGICVMRCRHPLSHNQATAGLKHLNRLDQVLASLELANDCQEGLMCDAQGRLLEGIKSNVFLVKAGALATPALDRAGVAGIQRDVLLEMCLQHGFHVHVRDMDFAETANADEMFVCNSVFGIWPVKELRSTEGTRHIPVGSVTRALQNLLAETH